MIDAVALFVVGAVACEVVVASTIDNDGIEAVRRDIAVLSGATDDKINRSG